MNTDAFISEYLNLLLESDILDALDHWKQFFRKARTNRNYMRCYELLREIKRHPLPPPILAEVRFQEGLLYEALDDWGSAIKCFSVSEKIFEVNDNQRSLSNLLTHLGDALKRQGRWDEALNCYRRALEIDRTFDDLDSQMIDLQDIASIFESQGRYSEAIDSYMNCIRLLGDSTDRDRGAKLIKNAAYCMSAMGKMNEAISLLELSLKLYPNTESIGYATVLITLGSVFRRQGKLDEASKAFNQAMSLISDLKEFYLESVLVNHFGTLAYERGQFDEAIEKYSVAKEMKQQLGDLNGVAVVLNNMGMLYLKMGISDKAMDHMMEALSIHKELGDVRGIAITQNNLANILVDKGRFQEALQYYLECIELCRKVGILDVQVISLRRVAKLYRELKDITQAELAESEIARLGGNPIEES